MNNYPKVSFLITAYNHELYVYDTIVSACSQNYCGEMEILISDDASTDNTWKMIQKALVDNTSKYDVHAFRNEYNMGIGGNVANLFSRATGDIIVFSDGDDISYSHRVDVLVKKHMQFPHILLLDSNYDFLCGTNIFSHFVEAQEFSINDFITGTICLSGCTRSIKRIVIDKYPPISTFCPTGDSITILRALLLGNGQKVAAMIDDTLVKYRIHENQVSNSINIKKINRISIVKQYISDIKYALKHKFISKRYILGLILFIIKYGLAAALQNNKIWQKIRKR